MHVHVSIIFFFPEKLHDNIIYFLLQQTQTLMLIIIELYTHMIHEERYLEWNAFV